MQTEQSLSAGAGAAASDPLPPEPPRRAAPAWLTDYLRANLMAVVWQSAVVLGGVILAVHFLYIGFFPELDWQSSLALLAVIALTGLSIWVLICLLLTFPSFVWLTFLEDLVEGPPVGDAAHHPVIDSPPSGAYHVAGPPDGTAGLSWWKPSLLFGGPALFFWLLFALVVWFRPALANEAPGWTLLALFAVTAVAGLITYHAVGGRDVPGPRLRPLRRPRYLLAALAGSLVSFVPVFLTYLLAYSRYNTTGMRPLTFAGAALIGFMFNGAALQRWLRGGPRRGVLASFTGSLLVGGMLALSITAATGNWVLIPEGVARLYALGSIEAADLVLDKEGCAVAKALKVNPEPVAETELCRLPRVKIKNRLGKTYYVEAQGGIKFTLPSGVVKSEQLPP
jgi:hypothetical protein